MFEQFLQQKSWCAGTNGMMLYPLESPKDVGRQAFRNFYKVSENRRYALLRIVETCM